MDDNTNRDSEAKEIDRYERIVDRAHNEIESVRTVYKWLATILGIIIAVGLTLTTIMIGNTIEGMKKSISAELDFTKSMVINKIDEEFNNKNIKDLVIKQTKIRVDTVADELIGNHVENKINPRIKEVRTKLKALDDKTEVLREEFATLRNVLDDKTEVLREEYAIISKELEIQINQVTTSADAHAKMLEDLIKRANLPQLSLSSHFIQKVETGYEIKLAFNPSNEEHLGTIVFRVQVVDASEAKIVDFTRLGISTNVKHAFGEDGKTARFQYSPMSSETQQIKIQVSGACKLSISGNYLPEPVNIVVGEKSHIIKPYSESQERFQNAMEIARNSGYIFLLIPDDNTMTNYYLAPKWMDKAGKPLLLTDSEKYIIEKHTMKDYKQDLMTLTFNNYKEIVRSGLLESRFSVQNKEINLTSYEKLGIIAVYTNMLKSKFKE